MARFNDEVARLIADYGEHAHREAVLLQTSAFEKGDDELYRFYGRVAAHLEGRGAKKPGR